MIRLRILQLIVLSVAWACREGPDLDPAHWSAGELDRFTTIAQDPAAVNLPMTGDTAIIAGIADARAVRAGFETLKQGGSAADAALTTALADVVLSMQSIVSFAGEMTSPTTMRLPAPCRRWMPPSRPSAEKPTLSPFPRSTSRPAARRWCPASKWPYAGPLRLPVGEGPGLFSEATIRGVQRLGVDVEMVTRPEDAGPAGAWLGVSIDRATGRIAAALGSPSRGIALGW